MLGLGGTGGADMRGLPSEPEEVAEVWLPTAVICSRVGGGGMAGVPVAVEGVRA